MGYLYLFNKHVIEVLMMAVMMMLGPRHDSPRPVPEIEQRRQLQQATSQEVGWNPAQLMQRYVNLAGHRDGQRADTLLKNNMQVRKSSVLQMGPEALCFRVVRPSVRACVSRCVHT